MNKKQERRIDYPMSEEKIYKLPELEEFIDKERRHDELSRLNEVRQQKKVWLYTLVFSGLLNLMLLAIGLMGVGK
ncbi:MAG: hypothetical protein GY793_07310 [Proteobacteria bacterium]|nr:hypothetical protein [Pseudomonadota bacterium]